MWEEVSLACWCIVNNRDVVMLTALQRLAMAGIQTHIESPLEQVRHIGMVVGECLMNKFNSLDKEHRLKFDYATTQDIENIKELSKPLTLQEEELKKSKTSTTSDPIQETPLIKYVQEEGEVVINERFGEGMVNATECSDTDR